MALTAVISQKELERVAGLAYEGETLKVMLCTVGISGFTAESTVANWQTVEQSGGGYVRYSEVIGTGSYSSTQSKYLLPVIDAVFTATGAGYTFNTVVVYINGALYPYAVITEDPSIIILDGQTQTYRITLNTDD